MLEILYQDETCVAVNKPAGMLVHRSWLDTAETQFVVQTLRNQLGRYVYPVHRLDRPTSGVLLFAFDSDNARRLTQQFENHQVSKTYWAVVRGFMIMDEKKHGVIDYPLSQILDKIADKHAIEQLKLTNESKEKQSAVTHWQCLATTEQAFQARNRYSTSRYSWVSLTPQTGRKHQLRRHMKHVFHPIIGDTSYGDHHQNRAIRQHIGVNRLMLHARELQFIHPLTQQKIRITTDVDTAWIKMFDYFGWDLDGGPHSQHPPPTPPLGRGIPSPFGGGLGWGQ